MGKAAKIFAIAATVLTAGIFLLACGGGGGDSGISYSGNMSAAAITNTSAEPIAVAAYEGGETGAGIAGTGGGPMGGTSPSPTSPLPSSLVGIKDRVAGAVNRALSGAGVSRAMIHYAPPPMYGGCGGSTAMDINIDEATGDFNGTLTFANMCEYDYDGVTKEHINGTVDFSGNVNISVPGELNYFAMSFNSLTVVRSDGTVNATLDGSILLTMNSPTSITMTMDMVMLDNRTGKTFWVNNYVVNVTDLVDHQQMTVSGRFYHFDHGYVDITTPTPLQNYPFDEHPYAGVLQLDGSGGRSIQLTFVDPNTYQVTVALDGDHVYDDYDSGPLTWQ